MKSLESHGIGRPSTYASIIETLRYRRYVEMSGRAFVPTDIGKIVSKFLVKYLGTYVEYGFTAAMEDVLDEISNGEKEWHLELGRFWKPFIKSVDHVQKNVTREEVAESREIGKDPVSGKPISVRMGQYGPFVQQGTRDDADKPRFASLLPGQHMDDVTLADALKLLSLPRDLGHGPDGTPISVGRGQYGPYVKYGAKYASIKEDDPFALELPRALEIVEAKILADRERTILDFPDAGIQVLKGRYGPYVTDKKKNAKAPKDRDPASLTLEECQALHRRGARAQGAVRPLRAPQGCRACHRRRRRRTAEGRRARKARDAERPAKPKATKPKAAKKKPAAKKAPARDAPAGADPWLTASPCAHGSPGSRRASSPRSSAPTAGRVSRATAGSGRKAAAANRGSLKDGALHRAGRRQFLGSLGREPPRLRDARPPRARGRAILGHGRFARAAPQNPHVPTTHLNLRFFIADASGRGARLVVRRRLRPDALLPGARGRAALAPHGARRLRRASRQLRAATRPGATAISSCRTGTRRAASAGSSSTT